MDKNKNYTPEELADAEKLIKTLAQMPKEKRDIVVMIANAFIDGMEAEHRRATAAAAS